MPGHRIAVSVQSPALLEERWGRSALELAKRPPKALQPRLNRDVPAAGVPAIAWGPGPAAPHASEWVPMLRRAGAHTYSARPRGGGPLRFALPALRVLGALGLGLGLGISSIQVTGVIKTDPPGLLVPIIVYALIGGGVLVVASPGVGGFLLLGWAAPWLLVLL